MCIRIDLQRIRQMLSSYFYVIPVEVAKQVVELEGYFSKILSNSRNVHLFKGNDALV